VTDRNEMQISESELRGLTAEMNEMHQATFPKLKEMLTDFGGSLRSKGASRRSFLVGSGVVLGSAALAACGSDDDGSSSSSSSSKSTSPSASASGGGDKSGLATNASLENLAVFAYMTALSDAPKGKFGPKVPPAIAEFATHAMKQHEDHADAFNAALVTAGGAKFTDVTPSLKAPVLELYGAVKDLGGLAKLALTLENTAAATYVKQMGEFTSPEALAAVATIAPVERQHAAILSYVLGEYPVPDTFVKLEKTDTSLGAIPNDAAGV
jgi:rubrerythrin